LTGAEDAPWQYLSNHVLVLLSIAVAIAA
jgi:hypothetical protein